MTPVFDSNIIIDFLEGSHDAKAEIESYSKRLISIVAYIEAMIGIREPKRQEVVKQLLHEEFEIIPLHSDIVEIAIQIRRDKRLKLPDAIIWATAIQQNTLLVTRNSKDFPKITRAFAYLTYLKHIDVTNSNLLNTVHRPRGFACTIRMLRSTFNGFAF